MSNLARVWKEYARTLYLRLQDYRSLQRECAAALNENDELERQLADAVAATNKAKVAWAAEYHYRQQCYDAAGQMRKDRDELVPIVRAAISWGKEDTLIRRNYLMQCVQDYLELQEKHALIDNKCSL